MRKVALIAVLLAGLGLAAGFTQAAPTTPTFKAENTTVAVTGDASVYFGVNLDTMATGFSNSAEAALTLTLIPATTVERTGKGPIYGYIQLSGLTVGGTNTTFTATAPTIVAKLVLGKTYLQIDTAPTISADLESLIRSFTTDLLPLSAIATTYSVSGGFKVGYDGKDASVSLAVGSGRDWLGSTGTSNTVIMLVNAGDFNPTTDVKIFNDPTATGQFLIQRTTVTTPTIQPNAQNAYAADLGFSISAENLSLGGSLVAGINYETTTPPVGFGFNFSYALPLDKTFSLVPVIGFDGRLSPPSNVLTWAVGAGLRLKWPGTYGADMSIVGRTQTFAVSQTVYSGLTVSADYSVLETGAPTVGLNVSTWEDSGDAGLFPGLGWAAAFEIANATSATPAMAVKTYVDYTSGNVKPYVGVSYNAPAGATPASGNAMAGLLLSNIFANTALNVYYFSGNLLATDPVLGEFVTQLKITF